MLGRARLSIFRQISNFKNSIQDLGIILKFGSDFEFFNDIPNIQPERHRVSPAFNPKHYPLDNRNAIWMVGYNKHNEIVCTQAIKLLNLGDGNLSNFFEKNLHELRIEGFDHDENRTFWELTSRASSISGKVAYHGELWLKGGPNGIRGGSTTTLLTRLMLLIAIIKLDPDYFIGFQSPVTACRGLSAREGYMHLEQRSIVWQHKELEEPIEDWLVWMSNEEAEFNLRLTPELLCPLFEDKKKSPPVEKLEKIA